jgi:hypothetical protein
MSRGACILIVSFLHFLCFLVNYINIYPSTSLCIHTVPTEKIPWVHSILRVSYNTVEMIVWYKEVCSVDLLHMSYICYTPHSTHSLVNCKKICSLDSLQIRYVRCILSQRVLAHELSGGSLCLPVTRLLLMVT